MGPQGTLAMSRGILVVTTRGVLQALVGGGQQNILVCTGQPSTIKDSLAQNVPSAEMEKLCTRQTSKGFSCRGTSVLGVFNNLKPQLLYLLNGPNNTSWRGWLLGNHT